MSKSIVHRGGDGKQDQGTAITFVCRPDKHRDDACQSTEAVVLISGLSYYRIKTSFFVSFPLCPLCKILCALWLNSFLLRLCCAMCYTTN